MTLYEGDLRLPAGARFAILASRWNARITDALVAGARRCLADNGVPEDAEARAGGSHGNKGEEAALAALEMVNLLERLP